ncbi:MAG TPA: chemotaxis protein CheW [Thermodesulfovibrionales bacterium]|nr:chemotaxis protein CheW [Thermodesulfovibrionales bacterium]
MDIAKIRKKLKESGQEDMAKPGAEPEATPHREEGHTLTAPPPSGEASREKEAAETAQKEEKGEDFLVELLTFTLGNEEYAFRIDEIHEIIRPQRVTMIPKTGSHLRGITSLRGKIIPVVDLRRLLSLNGNTVEEAKQKILILKGPKGPFGAIIDRVVGVIRPSGSKIVETPPHLPEAQMRFIEGVAVVDGRFISIIRTEEAASI